MNSENYFRTNYSSTYDDNNQRICEVSDCCDAMENYAIEFAKWLENLTEEFYNENQDKSYEELIQIFRKQTIA